MVESDELDSKKRRIEDIDRKILLSQGPCYLKLLVSNLVAGSIIGKNGSEINAIEYQAGVTMKLSPNLRYYPGTQERICVICGELDSIRAALRAVINKVVMSSEDGTHTLRLKVVVPNSAVSAVIGRQGSNIKGLQENTGARVQISNREEAMRERIVNVSGVVEQVVKACDSITEVIQNDPTLKDHLNVSYSPDGTNPNSPITSTPGARPMPQDQQQFGRQFGSPGSVGSSPPAFVGYAPHPHENMPSAYARGSVVTPDVMGTPCEIEMQVPDSQVGLLIGKSGVGFNEIQQQSGARLHVSQKGDLVPGTQNRKVQISGSLNSVHAAHILIVQRLQPESRPSPVAPTHFYPAANDFQLQYATAQQPQMEYQQF
eukprot:Filipodium_phascolosomae@DN222_c0_g1_i1.p1